MNRIWPCRLAGLFLFAQAGCQTAALFRLFARNTLPYIRAMRHALRPLSALALALLLVFTAQSMAVARGMQGVGGAVVLCTGSGPVTILTDSEGQPISPAHICPECTLSLIVAVGQADAGLTHPMGRAEALVTPYPSITLAQRMLPFSARDPPAAV